MHFLGRLLKLCVLYISTIVWVLSNSNQWSKSVYSTFFLQKTEKPAKMKKKWGKQGDFCSFPNADQHKTGKNMFQITKLHWLLLKLVDYVCSTAWNFFIKFFVLSSMYPLQQWVNNKCLPKSKSISQYMSEQWENIK